MKRMKASIRVALVIGSIMVAIGLIAKSVNGLIDFDDVARAVEFSGAYKSQGYASFQEWKEAYSVTLIGELLIGLVFGGIGAWLLFRKSVQ